MLKPRFKPPVLTYGLVLLCLVGLEPTSSGNSLIHKTKKGRSLLFWWPFSTKSNPVFIVTFSTYYRTITLAVKYLRFLKCTFLNQYAIQYF